MSGVLVSALVTMPRAGRAALALDTARAVPGVVAAIEARDWGGRLDGVLPAGHVVAALAARGDAALRRGLAALSLRVDPVRPVTKPELPVLPLTLRAARGLGDPLRPLTVTGNPDGPAPEDLLGRIATALAVAAGAKVRLSLSPVEALAALPQRPATAVGLRLDLDAQGQPAGVEVQVNRQVGGGTAEPSLALALPVRLVAREVPTDAAPARPEATDAAAVALLELALQEHALASGQDPLLLRAGTLSLAPRDLLLALQPGWSGPRRGLAVDEAGRLRQGAGLAAGREAAVHVELLVDVETGHVLMPVCRIALASAPPRIAAAVARGHGLALTEEAAIDPETGALLVPGFADFRLATSFTLPDIEIVPCAVDAGTPTPDTLTALVAAAILTALADALGRRPGHLPMTPDRILALAEAAGPTRRDTDL